jgi:tetratricopeptide (TPR) repeat protein/2-polyprenyl-3-methyl-5-hydroxy-6-metoxy-1,4-benzoquinol methylase
MSEKSTSSGQSANPPPEQQTLTIQQALDLAGQHHTAGRLPQAESIYQQILQSDPNQPVALHLLGVIAHQVGKNDVAIDLITKSLSISPNCVGALYNLGLTLRGLGELDEAVASYRKVLAIKPDYAEAHNNLGNALRELGKLDEAIASYCKALNLKPNHAEAHNNLGNALQAQGKLDEAVASFHKALAITSNRAEVHSNLGLALNGLGKLDEAVASYQTAVAIEPNFADAHNYLGNALHGLGRLDEAVASYSKALAIKADFAEVFYNLGNALHGLGRLDEAFGSHRRAITLNPGNDMFWAGLATTLETLLFTFVDDNLWRDLLQLLEQSTVHPSRVVQPIISALRLDPNFSRILELAGTGKPGIEIAYGDIAKQLSAMPLFLRIMELSPIHDLKIERMLTYLRRAMLQETMAGKADEKGLPFATALALQCYTNEYVFPETDEEETTVERLEQQIATLVENARHVPPSFVATLGAYRPLHSFSWAQELSEREWAGNIEEVIERQISEPGKEWSLRSRIPCLTAIHNPVSQSVREQYEENPYPRWISTGVGNKGKTIGAVLQGVPLHFDLGDYETPESPEILVAGCGTGQHALVTASRFSNSRVLAVDLSLNSLTYALRKTNDLDFSNIEYAQGDIMELGSLERRFDLIECAGVLHHLGDPLAGWRVLVGLLRPGGLMRIGLYSETARRGVGQPPLRGPI